MSGIRDLNLTQFQGGLNLRANEFTLADSESPDMLNVEVDPRGGVQTRKGWEKWNTTEIADVGTWNPRHAFMHELVSGLDIIMVTNNDRVLHSSNGVFAELATSGGPVVGDADTHLSDFAAWGNDLYIVNGSNATVKWNGSDPLAVEMDGISDLAHYANDYTEPGSSARVPKGKFACEHAGMLWVAGVTDHEGYNANRIRWSHPNNPERWKETDRLDILDGGGPITAILPLNDHLLVFKQSSIWAIYGDSLETLQRANVSRTQGAWSRETVTLGEGSVFLVSWPQGVYEIADGSMTEISVALRPLFESEDFNQSATDYMWLGWMDKRLWWSVPYYEDEIADDARSIFVFDPSLGSWTMFRSSENEGLGPFTTGGHGAGSYDQFGFCRCGPAVVRVAVRDSATDTITGEAKGFKSHYTTRWLFATTPTIKKRWKRPTFILQQQDQDYRLQVSVYHEFLPTLKRRFGVTQLRGNDIVRYDDGHLYDSGVEYSDTEVGSALRKASGLGNTPAVQLKIEGEVGKAWGLDGIVFFYKERKMSG